MKKIVSVLLLLFSIAFGSTKEIERQIYAHIFRSLVPNKQTIAIYVESPHKKMILSQIPFVEVVPSIKEAQIVLLDKEINDASLCHKLVLVGNYYLLKRLSSCAVGGFFWHKGRPTVIFLEPNIKKFHIHLPPDMQKYVESEL